MTTEAPPVPEVLSKIVPQEYHDRPYLKDLLAKPQTPETFTELFKKLDNAEKLVGKKVGIPETDKDEEWTPFLEKLRPAKEEDYEVKMREGAQPDVEFHKALRAAFHGAGVSKIQAARFQEKMFGFLAEREKAMVAEQKKLEVEFDTISKAAFGEANKQVVDRVKAAMDEHAPKVFQPHLGKLDNTALTIMVGVIDSILRKYAPEDKLSPKGGGSGDEVGTLRDEGRKLMASDAYKDAFHPEHAKTKARVDEIYKQIGAAKK